MARFYPILFSRHVRYNGTCTPSHDGAFSCTPGVSVGVGRCFSKHEVPRRNAKCTFAIKTMLRARLHRELRVEVGGLNRRETFDNDHTPAPLKPSIRNSLVTYFNW